MGDDTRCATHYFAPVRSLLLLFLFCTGAAHAQRLRPADLAPLHGVWSGELMYIDYETAQPTTIPATLAVVPVGTRAWSMGFGYTEEPQANEMDTVLLPPGGRSFDALSVAQVRHFGRDSVRVTLEGNSEDDGKQVVVRKTWTAGPRRCTLRKETRPREGEPAFTLRHEYRFMRVRTGR